MANPRANEGNAQIRRGRRRRNLPRMLDMNVEVVELSPSILLATLNFICIVCNKVFARYENLNFHHRSHNLQSEVRKETSSERKEKQRKVYICPEPSCIHHDPKWALGDLTGVKKHYGRKHGPEKRWRCEKCPKKYAVEADWKAHMKICHGSPSSSHPPQPQPSYYEDPELVTRFTQPLPPPMNRTDYVFDLNMQPSIEVPESYSMPNGTNYVVDLNMEPSMEVSESYTIPNGTKYVFDLNMQASMEVSESYTMPVLTDYVFDLNMQPTMEVSESYTMPHRSEYIFDLNMQPSMEISESYSKPNLTDYVFDLNMQPSEEISESHTMPDPLTMTPFANFLQAMVRSSEGIPLELLSQSDLDSSFNFQDANQN